MNVLVVYGSKRGSTREIAEIIGRVLVGRGLEAEVVAASRTVDPQPFDAVVVGSAIYNNRWHRGARRFVRCHAQTLRTRPVWFFSSGPLDDSAARMEIPPPRQVVGLMALVDPRGHATFGGRLAADATGFPASAMARNGRAGDWRDAHQIELWGEQIASTLSASSVGM